MEESRAVPPDSCCRLKSRNDADGAVADVSLRISSAKSIMEKWPKTFYKKPPTIDLDDITGGKDWNGKQVPAKDVKEFMQAQLKGNRFWDNLECGGGRGSFDDLFNDKGECLLRTGPSQQCCCHEASLIEAKRCLPAKGAPNQTEAQQQVLESEYEEWSSLGGKKEGKLTDASGPDYEPDMQDIIKGVADPSMKDLPETEANKAKMVWDWVKAPEQWKKTCVEWKQVPYVISKLKSEEVKSGQSRTLGAAEKYETNTQTVYTQGDKEICAKWQWDRTCGADQGLFIKQIKAKCMTEKELTNIGALSFECPQDYSSRDPKCKCSGDCK